MKYLIDSDFLFGLQLSYDPHHKTAVKILRTIQKSTKSELVILNLVVQETATVLSKKDSQNSAIKFLDNLAKLAVTVLVVGEEDENLIWSLFKKQTKKGTSFIDCANLAMAKKYKFDGILSFDEFYPKNVKVS